MVICPQVRPLFRMWSVDGLFSSQSSYGVEDPEYAVTQLAQTTMRSELGKLTLDKVFRVHESAFRASYEINPSISLLISQSTSQWNVIVQSTIHGDILTECKTGVSNPDHPRPHSLLGDFFLPFENRQQVQTQETRWSSSVVNCFNWSIKLYKRFRNKQIQQTLWPRAGDPWCNTKKQWQEMKCICNHLVIFKLRH